MGVVTVKSAAISNRDATPTVLNLGAITGGEQIKALGVVAVGSADSATSKYVFCSVPSNAVVSSVKLSCPDIGTTMTIDIGLYKSTRDGGAVVDADFFTAAVNVHGGALSKSELLNGNIVTVANMEKRLWEHLGLSSDPGLSYDVCGTAAADTDAAGAVALEVHYSV